MEFFIPTLGRCFKQLTYNDMPQDWQDMTRFVVQKHEYDQMVEIYGKDKVVDLPESIKSIGPTRGWIFNNLGKYGRHIVFDDDLIFKRKVPEFTDGSQKIIWRSKSYKPEDFVEALRLVEQLMDEGYVFGGLMPSSIIPNIKYHPIRYNHRIVSNMYFNGPKMPTDLIWDRIKYGEDLDITLQLLTRGYSNAIMSEYCVNPLPGTDGGLLSERTIELHNKSQEDLAALWPQFISIRNKFIKSGPWANHTKKSLTIQFKKAYEYSQQHNHEKTN